MKIKVTVVESSRDGITFRWTGIDGARKQKFYRGRRHRNHIDAARMELENKLNRTGVARTWSMFVSRLEGDYFLGMSPRSIEKCDQTLRKFARHFGDVECSELSTWHMLDFESSLRNAGLAVATVNSTMATMWAILRYGEDAGLLPEVKRPRKRTRKHDRQSKSKGRSLATEEVERFLACIPRCTKSGEDAESFQRAAMAAWLMGLRLDDCHRLSFEPVAGSHWIASDLRSINFASDQKSGQIEAVPLEEPATRWLESVDQSLEWICRGRGDKGWHRTSNRLGRVLSAAGRAANIVVKRDAAGNATKHASAHDLRRTFASNLLARGMGIKDVQHRTRHADHNTLLAYYADVDRNQGGYSVVDESKNLDTLPVVFSPVPR